MKTRKLKMPGKNKNITKILIFFAIILISFCIACGNSSLKTGDNSAKGAPEQKISAFEKDLESLRTANFDYIFAFRRKDGGAMDSEDKAFLNASLPQVVNRKILSDDDKAVIAGSNYKFPPESLEKLKTRFNVEDFSTVKENEK